MSLHRRLLAPNGAKGYSHGCNERVLEQVEPVESSTKHILPRRGQRKLTDHQTRKLTLPTSPFF
jgi:hypothetical protein